MLFLLFPGVWLLFGIYAIVTAQFQVSRNYGVKGKGARALGAVCILFAFAFLLLPRVLLVFGVEVGVALLCGIVLPLGLFIAVLSELVRKYGNAFEKIGAPPSPD